LETIFLLDDPTAEEIQSLRKTHIKKLIKTCLNVKIKGAVYI